MGTDQGSIKRRNWSRKVIMRYILFQIPSLTLFILILILIRQWVNLHAWYFWGFIALWFAKDVILFPFVWRAYDRDRFRELQSLVGIEGIVEERLAPFGYVRVHGELWKAEVMEKETRVEKGEKVLVRDAHGLTLIVQPMQRESTMGKDSPIGNHLNKGEE